MALKKTVGRTGIVSTEEILKEAGSEVIQKENGSEIVPSRLYACYGFMNYFFNR
ncbi:MAG: hypothetical protein KGI02_04420 [Thaumarchaeota archaeon]|nr:hypothetical protein [Nitrososphaerota archaeon]